MDTYSLVDLEYDENLLQNKCWLSGENSIDIIHKFSIARFSKHCTRVHVPRCAVRVMQWSRVSHAAVTQHAILYPTR